MQIGTSQFYATGTSQLGKLSAQADTLNTQIATGKKITAPSQDVVAYNRLSAIKQANADNTAYASNISLAKSLLQQSDTTLTAVTSQLQRAAELTTQAANGTLNDANRKAIATELQSIRDDLVNLAGTTDARGQPLFAAATGKGAVTQAADGTVTFDGTGEVPAIPVGDGTDVRATDSAQRACLAGSQTARAARPIFSRSCRPTFRRSTPVARQPPPPHRAPPRPRFSRRSTRYRTCRVRSVRAPPGSISSRRKRPMPQVRAKWTAPRLRIPIFPPQSSICKKR